MMMRTGGGSLDERFEALYRKYYPRVYRFFYRGISNDEAQDLAQETFKRIYETFATYRGEAEWAFIEKTARNVLLNRFRSGRTQKRNAETVPIDDLAPNDDRRTATEQPDLVGKQEEAMQRARLWAAIAELPEGQRQCMELWLGDTKYEAIAKMLGISVEAVKSRLRDGRKALRAKLGDGLPEDEE